MSMMGIIGAEIFLGQRVLIVVLLASSYHFCTSILCGSTLGDEHSLAASRHAPDQVLDSLIGMESHS